MRAFEFGEEFVPAEGFRARLLPAGHIFGSAQIRIERESDGASLLYTGDFKLRPGLSSETAETAPADTLVMETTYGLPRYRFPATADVVREIVNFAVEAIEDGEVPVLLGYSLGKAQEILGALAGVGLPVMLHESVLRMTEVYARLRPGIFPPYRRFESSEVAGHVVIFPPSGARAQVIRRLRKRRVAMLTGWALQPGAQFRYQVDAVFPLSDHADHPDLLAMVDRVRPARVYTLHGFAAEFAAELRRRGIEAWSAGASDQLELPLWAASKEASCGTNDPGAVESSPLVPTGAVTGERRDEHTAECGAERAPESDAPNSGDFGAFVRVCVGVGEATGRRRKIGLLAGYLRSLPDSHEIEIAARWLSGRLLPRRESATEADGDARPGRSAARAGISGARSLAVGWSLIRRTLIQVAGIGEARYRTLSASVADTGRTAHLVLADGWDRAGRPPAAGASTLTEIDKAFRSLRAARGPAAKTAVLAELLASLPPEQGGYVVRLLTGDLRIGLREGLVEEAVAEAFACPVEEVRDAAMLLGHVGEAAVRARAGTLTATGLVPFVPVQCMLAGPEPSAAAIWERLAPSPEAVRSEGAAGAASRRTVWLEDKFDGIRAQIHAVGDRVEIYSRDLRCVTAEFPELASAAAGTVDDAVLDGEIVAYDAGRRLTFFDLQRRLNRRRGPDLFEAEAAGGVPVRFVAFDLLWLEGETLLSLPLEERRSRLDGLRLPDSFIRAEVVRAGGPDAVEAAFAAARARGNEGLIAKDSRAAYRPGRRGRAWLKLKKAAATLDVVVVRVQRGHGKRSHVFSDYTFAVRDERDGQLKVIGKAYTGLTDAEIEELTEHFLGRALSRRRDVVDVEPEIVLEVAFDSIRPSRRHDSGLALRFPRIHALRRDKSAQDIDTLQRAEALAADTGEGIVHSRR